MNQVMECDKCYIIYPGDFIPEEGFFDRPCNNIIKDSNGLSSQVCGGKWVLPNEEIERKRWMATNKKYCVLDPKTNPGIFLVVLDSKNRMMRHVDFPFLGFDLELYTKTQLPGHRVESVKTPTCWTVSVYDSKDKLAFTNVGFYMNKIKFY